MKREREREIRKRNREIIVNCIVMHGLSNGGSGHHVFLLNHRSDLFSLNLPSPADKTKPNVISLILRNFYS